MCCKRARVDVSVEGHYTMIGTEGESMFGRKDDWEGQLRKFCLALSKQAT